MNLQATDDLRITAIRPLVTPQTVIAARPATDTAMRTVRAGREAIHDILAGRDNRLLVIVGPCSIHDPSAALDYAAHLKGLRDKLSDRLEIVMRVYFEKPRTTVGWKGLINDPALDGSFDINRGLHIARDLLVEINEMGLPAATEFLDTTTPQYVADLVTWGAIGARTTESQIHRELASGLSCPVGFKNGTDGNVKIAVDAVTSAAHSHHFLAVMKSGETAIAATTGNEDCHIILRGGRAPNYDEDSVASAVEALEKAGLAPRVMVDASHGNSLKKPENQPKVTGEIARRVAAGDRSVFGLMIESHLVAGRQDQLSGESLTYGQSITDGCIGWDTTMEVLGELADAVGTRERVAEPA